MDSLLVGLGVALLVTAIVGEAVTIAGSKVPQPRTRQIRIAFGVLGIVLIVLGLFVNGAIRIPDGRPEASASPSAATSPSTQPSPTPPESATESAEASASEPSTPQPTVPPTPPVTPAPTNVARGPWRGMPAAFNDGVDAALIRSTGQIYFFDGRLYVRFNDLVSGKDSGPIVTAENWHGLPDEFAARIDAACTGNGVIYLFRNDSYVRFTEDLSKSASPPRSIAADWPGLPSSFVSKIDAAFTDGDGRVYLFRGNQYVRFSDRPSGADGGFPERISSRWTGMPEEFNAGIDAALMTPDGATWFFHDAQYVRFAPGQFTVDAGYPRPIDE